jgi:hypothetical protein
MMIGGNGPSGRIEGKTTPLLSSTHGHVHIDNLYREKDVPAAIRTDRKENATHTHSHTFAFRYIDLC